MKISKYDINVLKNFLEDAEFWEEEIGNEFSIFKKLREAQKEFEDTRSIEGYEGMDSLSESIEAVVIEMKNKEKCFISGFHETVKRIKEVAEKAQEIEAAYAEQQTDAERERCPWCMPNETGEYNISSFESGEESNDGKEITLSFYKGRAHVEYITGENDTVCADMPIRFCPICGREFEVKDDETES